ncbi:hypothetical protein NS274_07805 [Pseudomonas oryzihabitans]|nr:hypothetical protein NS274_07805 [Pseudomonas psychrotolerans]
MDYCDDEGGYRSPEQIDQMELYSALNSLMFFSGNLDFSNQAMNLAVVDEFVMGLEYDYLRSKFEETKSPYQALFLSAQSQMWIFAAYELLRTWRQKLKAYLRTADSSGLLMQLKELQKPIGYENYVVKRRIAEVSSLIESPKLVESIRNDLKRTHILFTQMELLRMSLAKHELRKRPGALVLTPTVGYMNRLCGSLEYQINSGQVILCNLSRRMIADGIREIPSMEVPSPEDLEEFEKSLRSPSNFASEPWS